MRITDYGYLSQNDEKTRIDNITEELAKQRDNSYTFALLEIEGSPAIIFGDDTLLERLIERGFIDARY